MFKKPKFFFYFFIFLSLLYSDLISQNSIRFREFPLNTFPGNNIESIYQDSYGYLWFGTFEGVVRYDGTNLNFYYHQSQDKNSLKPRNAITIIEDSDNNLWIGGSQGLSIYNRECDCFTNADSIFNSLNVRCIVEDEKKQLWIGAYEGFLKYDLNTKEVIRYSSECEIHSLLLIKNLLYIGTGNSYIKVFDIESEKMVKYISPNEYPQFAKEDISVMSILKVNNSLWFVTKNGGLYEYNLEKQTVEKTAICDENNNKIESLFFTIVQMRENELLIGTQYDGLLKFNIDTKQYIQYTTINQPKFEITSKTVRAIYKDREETIWIGTHQGGLCYFNLYDIDVNYIYYDNTLSNGLQYGVVSSFIEDEDENFWVATDGGGLHLYNKQYENFTSYKTPQYLKSDAITDLVKDTLGNIYISQWYGGVTKMKDKKFQSLFFDASESHVYSSKNNIKGILYDSQNRLWIFPQYSSLNIYDLETQIFYNKENPGNYNTELFEKEMIADAVKDKNGNIWIYGYLGLFRYTKNNELISFNCDDESRIGLSSCNIDNMYNDSKNRTWISTYDGLELYNPVDSSLINLSKTKNFPRKVSALMEDNDGIIWISSNLGLGYFNPNDFELTYIEKNLNLSPGFFVPRASYKDKDGNIYFGSTQGLIKFNPRSIRASSYKPKVYISELYLFDNKVTCNDSISILTKPIYLLDTLVLKHSHSMIKFEFSSTSYINPMMNKFRYKLEGYTDRWHENGIDNKITFTNLTPGSYKLLYQSSNHEGVWGEENSLTIIVLPPWWQTWWSISIFIFSLILILVFVYWYRVQNLKKINLWLQKEVKIKTEELQFAFTELHEKNEEISEQNEEIETQKEQLLSKNTELEEKNIVLDNLSKTKDKFFSIIAHDLKNPMNALIGFADLLYNNPDIPEEKKRKYIQVINQSSKKTYALLVNLLDWARAQTNSISMVFKKQSLYSIIIEVVDLLKEQAISKDIKIKVLFDDNYTVYVDERTMNTVFRNLLSNAIKFTDKGGQILFYIESIREHHYVIAIEDNGQGMNSSQIEKLFEVSSSKSTKGTGGEDGTGLGLMLCKEFINHNDGDIWCESTLQKGTTFFVTIPIA